MSKKSDYFTDLMHNDKEYYSICKQLVINEQENVCTLNLEKLANKRLDYLEERCEEFFKIVN